MKYAALCFFISCCFSVCGQEAMLRNYQVKDGLPSSEVYDVMQDSRGYMWFATDAGVSRFNGYYFENFTTENGLSDNTVFGLHEDHKGRIWFRTLSGTLSYYFSGHIFSIEANIRISSLQQNSVMTSIYVDKGDTIWCGLMDGNFPYYKIPPAYKILELPDTKRILHPYMLKVDREGSIWGEMVTMRKKMPDTIQVLDHRAQDKFICLVPAKVGIRHMTLLKDGSVCISFFQRTKSVLTSARSLPTLAGNPEIIVTKEDHHGNLWLGTSKQGAFCIAIGDTSRAERNYLKGYSVTNLVEDREGGIWMTTLENGIYYLPYKNVWSFIPSGGISDSKAMSLIPRADDGVLVGFSNGRISIIDGDRSKPGQKVLGHDKSRHISYIEAYHKDSIFICGGPGLLLNTRLNSISYVTNKGLENYIKCFAIDRNHNGWAANHHSLIRLNADLHTIAYNKPAPGRVNKLYFDKHGTLWLGCFNGLWKFEQNRFSGFKNSLLRSRVEDIKENAAGELWIATRGRGVLILKDGKVRQITQKEGLASNIIKTLMIDSSGTVWVGTNNGISKIIFHPPAYRIRNFSMKNGLLPREINQLGATEHFIWAATNQGIIRMDINENFPNPTAPPVYITHVNVGNRQADSTTNYTLKYNDHFIRINYMGLSYLNPGQIRYKYKLNGLDSIWNYTSGTSVQYTTLPPGNYTFTVYAINNDQVLSKVPAKIHLFVESPFWQKWWFLSLVILSGLCSIILFFRLRLRQLKRKEKEKTALNKKIAEIELRALRAQMNPHFIFNSINSIQHFILKNNIDHAHKYLSKFARLIRNVLENSKYESISIAQELETLQLYIELEALRFNFTFSYEIKTEEGIHTLFIPSMMIQPYVENAIWHGLMHKEGAGKLSIRFSRANDLLKCTIEDNGIGRSKSAEYRNDSIPRRSMGLSVTEERLEIINHIYNKNLHVTIIDKYHPEGLAAGTKVELSLPLINANTTTYA